MKVLIVASTVIYRKMLSDLIFLDKDLEIIGTSSNPAIAQKKLDFLKPDLLIIEGDFFLPENIESLYGIFQKSPSMWTIIFSLNNDPAKDIINKVIIHGTYNLIGNIQDADFSKKLNSSIEKLKTRLILKHPQNIPPKALSEHITSHKSGTLSLSSVPMKIIKTVESKINHKSGTLSLSSVPVKIARPSIRFSGKKEIVVIGISTGGPNALAVMLPGIPKDISVPILIVQHMPVNFTKTLGTSLNNKCQIEVREAIEGDKLEPGVALIAPGGKHMGLEKLKTGEIVTRVFDGEPVNNCKPSVDVLFYDVAVIYKDASLGVIMTGMGSDGTKGLREMKKAGSYIIAQDEKTCVVFGMPKAPIEEGIVDIVVPLENIAEEIMKIVGIRRI